MQDSIPEISLVVPVYNEQDVLSAFYAAVLANSSQWNCTWELIFVDDGSVDNSKKILHSIADGDEHVRIIHLSRNFGHQPALSAGMSKAKGDAIIMMDADLQDPPELIAQLIAKWREGFDVVYAIRRERKEGIFLRFAFKMFYKILHASSTIHIPEDSGDFSLISKRVAKIMLQQFPEKSRFLRGLRAYTGFQQTGVPYPRPERFKGVSKYSLSKLMRLAFDGWFGFSNKPLRIATYLGVLFAVPSFFIGLLYIFNKLFGFTIYTYPSTDQPGVATITVAVFFIGGITLFILGIIGEYIARIYEEVKARPTFIIESEYVSNKTNT
ncbi:MAG: glycosyltransferase family 2 protein [Chitinophagales bacterium]